MDIFLVVLVGLYGVMASVNVTLKAMEMGCRPISIDFIRFSEGKYDQNKIL